MALPEIMFGVDSEVKDGVVEYKIIMKIFATSIPPVSSGEVLKGFEGIVEMATEVLIGEVMKHE